MRGGRERADWQHAVRATIRDDDATALDWARAIFEGAPRWLRTFLVLSWRYLLLLDVAPHRHDDRVLGWRIADTAPHAVRLAARSRFGIESLLTVSTADGTLTFATSIACSNPVARVVWTLAAPLHRLIVTRLVTRAARR